MSFSIALANTNKWGQLWIVSQCWLDKENNAFVCGCGVLREDLSSLQCQRGFQSSCDWQNRGEEKGEFKPEGFPVKLAVTFSSSKLFRVSTGVNLVLVKEAFHFSNCTLSISGLSFLKGSYAVQHYTFLAMWRRKGICFLYIEVYSYVWIEQLFLPSFLCWYFLG